MRSRILAAIPAYNEEVAIGSVILRCQQYADEVLVVDDGSEDGTSGVAKLAKAVVIRHDQNNGKGVAIQSALSYARMNGFGAMVLLDGDGQHDPREIPSLLAPILRGDADLAVGVRRRATSGMPLHRRVGQRILDFLTAFGSMSPVTDSQCGFRALSRAAIESLLLEERDFGVESEMLIDAEEKNLRIAEVPIHARYDVDGSTKGPISHGFSVVDRILRIIAVRHPLLFFAVPGLVLFALGLWFGFDTLQTYNTTRVFAIGKAILTIVFLSVGGLAVFAGVILNVMPGAVARSVDNQIPNAPSHVLSDVRGPMKGTLSHTVRLVDRMLRIIAVRYPLLFFAIPGLVLFTVGLWWGLDTVIYYNATHDFPPGKALISVAALTLGGLAVFAGVVLGVMPGAVNRTLEKRKELEKAEK